MFDIKIPKISSEELANRYAKGAEQGIACVYRPLVQTQLLTNIAKTVCSLK